MILYKNKYIRVNDPSFQTKLRCVMQLASPQIIGIIHTFPDTPGGEENRVKYLADANLDVTGKANGYRVFCHPYGSTQKLGKEITADELRQIMTEMANYYVEGLLPNIAAPLKNKKEL